MLKLILLIFVCTLISTGYLQEIGNNPLPPNLENNEHAPIWPFNDYQLQRRRVKPCPRRSNNDVGDQWVPSSSTRITRPLHEPTVLQPQALKNSDFIPNSEENNIDVGNEHNFPSSVDSPYQYMRPSNIIEEDCNDQFESVNGDALSNPDAAKAALKLIEDCLKMKQNNGWSRRSMSDPHDGTDTNNPADPNDGDNNYKLTTKLMDPEKGTGIAEKREFSTHPSHSRVCYACSTSTNPSCWEPNNSTTVKYCAREHACVTKTFGVKNTLTLIRDCANTCEDSPVPGIEPKYKSCKLCHKDLCNGAFSINSYNLAIILIISIVKCTF